LVLTSRIDALASPLIISSPGGYGPPFALLREPFNTSFYRMTAPRCAFLVGATTGGLRESQFNDNGGFYLNRYVGETGIAIGLTECGDQGKPRLVPHRRSSAPAMKAPRRSKTSNCSSKTMAISNPARFEKRTDGGNGRESPSEYRILNMNFLRRLLQKTRRSMFTLAITQVCEWVPCGGRKFGQLRYACRNAINLSVAARSAHLCPIFQEF